MPLNAEQRNDVLAALLTAGLNPREFDWQTRANYAGSQAVLAHKRKPYFFDFVYSHAAWTAAYEPGADAPDAFVRDLRWTQELYETQRWAHIVQRELETPDLWAELERENAALEALAEAENSPFTADELQRLAADVDQLKSYAATTYQLSKEHSRQLDAVLTYVLEAAPSARGRFDWWNIFAGVLITKLLDGSLPPDLIQGLLRLGSVSFGHLFGTPPTELLAR